MKLERRAALMQGKGYGAGSLKKEVQVASSLLKYPPNIVVDIGANIGEYSSELRKNFPAAELHLFEPSNSNVKKLQRRFGDDELVYINPLAVSSRSQENILYTNEDGSGLASLIKRRLDHININFDKEEIVKSILFEDYWELNLKERMIDFIKIDIEGHELDALSGFGKALSKTRLLQFEFGGCNLDSRTNFQDFWYFFYENEFSLFRITPFGAQPLKKYQEIDEFYSTTNFLALNRANN